MNEDTLVKGLYRHFKGEIYNATNTAFHSETEEQFVIYHNIKSPGKLWIRPLQMFNEVIERNGKQMKRFELIRKAGGL